MYSLGPIAARGTVCGLRPLITALAKRFAAESPGANVRVVAVTPAGKLLKPISVLEFLSLKNRKESYAQRFRGEAADHIPLGEYLVTVHADDRDISQTGASLGS